MITTGIIASSRAAYRSRTIPAGLTWTQLTIVDSAFITVTGNILTSNTALDWNATALFSPALTADGAVRVRYNASDQINTIFGFRTTNARPADYNPIEAAFILGNANDVYTVQSGVFSAALTTISINDYVQIKRVGSTLTLEVGSDSVVWTFVATFTLSTSATLYPVISIYKTAVTEIPQITQ